ncbi:MAG: RNA 3'-terminal phosphate cyclase [Lentisphaeria bacterium]|nr:RNA 3'-terminal phosphate cyclase [Lentisphaeria bacterium]
MNRIEIDGSYGEGGGQILRTSLSLAAVTGQAVHFTKIRANRRKPGLMRQHRICALAAAEITGGKLTGAELNSQEMTFEPGSVRGGEYHFTTGSAGSTMLIAQTVVPILLQASEPSRVFLEGGTHAPGAPVFDFFDRVFLPGLRRMGCEVQAKLVRYGFYPVGGGQVELEIRPVREWRPLELTDGGEQLGGRIVAIGSGIDREILEDEVRITQELVGSGDWKTEILEADSPGPGNVVYLELVRKNITELFSVCGEFEVSRKTVAERVADMARKYLQSGVAVGRCLADQLLLPMALLQGGKFLNLPPSLHTKTNAAVIQKFLETEIEMNNLENGTFIIEVKK